jgi:ubiquinol-cytochrome c reductase cytochrome c1 subunit
MKKVILAAAAATMFTLPLAANAAEAIALPQQEWSFNGVLGKFDKQQLQRGFQVYREVCSACHELKYIAFRNLEALGYSEAQVKALAAEYQVEDGPDDVGDMFMRPAKGSDYLPPLYDNEAMARSMFNGALPPDLSLMTKARADGPNYVYNLLVGYEEPPAGVELSPGMNYNKYFPGHQIAMAPPIDDPFVEFADGTPVTKHQVAKDVTAFLHWAAEPNLDARHSMGIKVMLYTLLFTILAYLLKVRVWSRLKK